MTPIIGEITYKELSPEDIARFTREAEAMRADAVRAMFIGIYRGIANAMVHLGHAFRALVTDPGIHPSTGVR